MKREPFQMCNMACLRSVCRMNVCKRYSMQLRSNLHHKHMRFVSKKTKVDKKKKTKKNGQTKTNGNDTLARSGVAWRQLDFQRIQSQRVVDARGEGYRQWFEHSRKLIYWQLRKDLLRLRRVSNPPTFFHPDFRRQRVRDCTFRASQHESRLVVARRVVIHRPIKRIQNLRRDP